MECTVSILVPAVEEGTSGIRDLFSNAPKMSRPRTKILVASLDPKFAELVKATAAASSQFYPTPAETLFENTQELLEAIPRDMTSCISSAMCRGRTHHRRSRQQGCWHSFDTSLLRSDVKLLWLPVQIDLKATSKVSKHLGNH